MKPYQRLPCDRSRGKLLPAPVAGDLLKEMPTVRRMGQSPFIDDRDQGQVRLNRAGKQPSPPSAHLPLPVVQRDIVDPATWGPRFEHVARQIELL